MTKQTADWKFYLTLLVTIAGIGVPVLIGQLSIAAKDLSVRLVSSIALQPDPSLSLQNFEVTLDGVKIDSPYLSTIEVSNTGGQPISASDFENDLDIGVEEGAKLIRARTELTKPQDIRPHLLVDGNAIKVRPLLLNPDDSITITAVTSGEPKFNVRARIAGIQLVKYEDTRQEKNTWVAGVMFLAIALVSMMLYMGYAAHLQYPKELRVSRRLALVTMMMCAVAGAGAIRRAFDLLQIEATTVALLVGGGGLVLMATPMYWRRVKRARKALGSGGADKSESL